MTSRTFLGLVVMSGMLLVTGCGGGASNEAAAEGSGSGPAAGVTVVPHTTLETFLPNLPGWERLEPRGETDTTESVSRVTVDYEKPPSTLSFEFMDSSMNPDVLALINEAIKGQNPEMTPMMLKGFPGAEEWTPESMRGSVHVLVGGRFMVVVTGETMPDLASIRAVAETIDLAKMASLK